MSTILLIFWLLTPFSEGSNSQSQFLPDTTPPQIVAVSNCGAVQITLRALDTTEGDRGLQSLQILESNRAISVRFNGTFRIGDSSASVTIKLIDRSAVVRVHLVAVDLAGNADTLVLDLAEVIPSFTATKLFFEEIPRNDIGVERFVISNPSSNIALRIDSLRLLGAERFSIDGFGRGGPFGFDLIPGDTFGVQVTFTPGLPRTNRDTLVLYVDCLSYQFPIEATVGIARLDVVNLDFWQVLVGSEECLDITLINPGTDTVGLWTIDVDGDYRFDTTQIPELPIYVAPLEVIRIPICFLPRRLGLQLGQVTFISSEVDTAGTVAELAGIGVNAFASTGFDDQGNRLQVTVVPQRRRLTVVSADRDQKLGRFKLYNVRGEELRLDEVELIGRGWWGITTPDRLDVGIYLLHTEAEGGESLTVKFVVLE